MGNRCPQKQMITVKIIRKKYWKQIMFFKIKNGKQKLKLKNTKSGNFFPGGKSNGRERKACKEKARKEDKSKRKKELTGERAHVYSHWKESFKTTNRFSLHKGGGRRWERTEKSETGLFLKSGSINNQHSLLTFQGEKC